MQDAGSLEFSWVSQIRVVVTELQSCRVGADIKRLFVGNEKGPKGSWGRMGAAVSLGKHENACTSTFVAGKLSIQEAIDGEEEKGRPTFQSLNEKENVGGEIDRYGMKHGLEMAIDR